MPGDKFQSQLKSHSSLFSSVVRFNPENEKIVSLDFSKDNIELQGINIDSFDDLNKYIFDKLDKENARFGTGGYNEVRYLYERSDLFSKDLNDKPGHALIEEPRRLHIGTDIWGEEGTAVFAPLDSTIHSFAFNNHFGDYGATIILLHRLDGIYFHTLYGHLSLRDIENLNKGTHIKRGEKIGHFGSPDENGNWPPHLHFQIIKNIYSYKGDYPGVCKYSQKDQYLLNSPDPDIILNMRKFISKEI